MVLLNITNDEKKRFTQLQVEGLLPSEALNRLEAERRLGIVPESTTKIEDIGSYLALGAIGVGILYVYINSPRPTATMNKMSTEKINIDDVEGVDLAALYECQIRGLI